ncbi:MAG: DMT family transporter [Limibacillus sp.]
MASTPPNARLAPTPGTGPDAAQRRGQADRPLAAIGLLLLAMMIVPFMDATAKALSERYDLVQIVWARYFFHFFLIAPLVLLRFGPRGLAPPRMTAQIVRGGLLLGSTALFFAAIARMPLADALALVFVAPLIVTALSPWLLGEQVGVRRFSAVGVGFLGVLIIIRPGLGVFDLGALLALAGGTTFAFYLLATRRLSGTSPALVTLAFTALLGALLMTLLLPWFWKTPTLTDLALMASMGLIAAVGHLCVIKAYDWGEASLLAPFGYSEIITMTLVGYIFFEDFPDSWTWIGIAVVTGSGVYISLRERKRGMAK